MAKVKVNFLAFGRLLLIGQIQRKECPAQTSRHLWGESVGATLKMAVQEATSDGVQVDALQTE